MPEVVVGMTDCREVWRIVPGVSVEPLVGVEPVPADGDPESVGVVDGLVDGLGLVLESLGDGDGEVDELDGGVLAGELDDVPAGEQLDPFLPGLPLLVPVLGKALA